jgi:biotin transport system substrate-specific component
MSRQPQQAVAIATRPAGFAWENTSLGMQFVLVLSASVFIALCARITLPLPFTPVPLTVQNLGVLLVALLLGSRRGAAALLLYLAQGAAGLPVFNPAGPGGIAQLIGPTGGYLLAYPIVAFVTGWIAERGSRSFARLALAATAGEVVLFAGGVGWLYALTGSFGRAATFGLYPFFFAEVMKVMAAAGAAQRFHRVQRS